MFYIYIYLYIPLSQLSFILVQYRVLNISKPLRASKVCSFIQKKRLQKNESMLDSPVPLLGFFLYFYLFIYCIYVQHINNSILTIKQRQRCIICLTKHHNSLIFENSEIYFQFLEVDLKPVSPILAGPVCHCQSYPSRKLAALNCSLSKVVRASFYDNYLNVYLLHITSVSLIPLLTNEDDRRQQKEPAAPLMQVRTERESTPCFWQTRAVDAQVSAVTLMRLEDQVTYTKFKQNKMKSSESDQWP
ncbi:Hypothetical_protein [Hexamita inflata]|uniref:Hypothetical_protein n=1 Tax=Hexamita inflata TaxID=28002 RepID=A0AA86QAV4_9EUKA|nr:Hypothetical protein HINF_LOCUS36370 [Hexamita inflata]